MAGSIFALQVGQSKECRYNQSIAKDLERKFNVRIRVESDPLRKEIFSGSFTKDYSLDKILREVDVDHKYVWTRSGDEIIIKDK